MTQPEVQGDLGAVAESKRHKKYNGLSDMFNMQECPVCGKSYIIMDARTYAYQKQIGKKHMYFCSWGCYRKFLRDTGRL